MTIPNLKILNFKFDYINGIPGVLQNNRPVFMLNQANLFHGFPPIILRNKSFMGFKHSSEYNLFCKVRDALRQDWAVKNNYNYSDQLAKLRGSDIGVERTKLKHRIKELKHAGQDFNDLQERLDLISSDPEDFKKAQKAFWGMNSAALRFTNRVLKVCISTMDPKILNLVRRFPKEHRNSIFQLVSEHERLRQFVEAYPVLGLCIANAPNLHLEIKSAIISGQKIKDICELAKFPQSFRKIKPQNSGVFLRFKQMFFDIDVATPNVFKHLVPKKTMQQYRWMILLCDRYPIGRINMVDTRGSWSQWVYWLASVTLTTKNNKILLDYPLHQLKLDLSLCFDAFSAEPWGHNISFEGGVRRQEEWHEREIRRLERLREERALQSKIELTLPFSEPFLPGYAKDGWEIVPLRSPLELEDEGIAMHHCVAGYAGTVRGGYSYIYSVRNNDKRVATLELSSDHNIQQLRGYCNENPGESVFKAVKSWINVMSSKKTLDDEIEQRIAV